MLKWSVAAAVAVLVCGCTQPKAQERAETPEAPVGRFQMVAMSDAGSVYVLDTRDGLVSKCMTSTAYETWCTPTVKSYAGAPAPAWTQPK